MAFAVTTGGLLLAGTGYASADTATAPDAGVLTGNTVQVPAFLGINACGNDVGAAAATETMATNACSIAGSAPSATAQTGASAGLLTGNLVQIPIDVPVNLCGNSVLAAAAEQTTADADCSLGSGMSMSGANTSNTINAASSNTASSNTASSSNTTSSSNTASSNTASSSSGSSATADTGKAFGVGTGNVVQAPITLPVNLCGNLVSILGAVDSMGSTACMQSAPAPSASSSGWASPSASSSSYPSSSATPSPSSTSTGSVSQISQGTNNAAPVAAPLAPLAPLAPGDGVAANPIVFWPQPDAAQHVNLPQHAIPAKVTCDVAPAAQTEALGGVPGGALSTAAATAAAFASGTGLRVLGRRRRRRH
jgi:hypothetical protein